MQIGLKETFIVVLILGVLIFVVGSLNTPKPDIATTNETNQKYSLAAGCLVNESNACGDNISITLLKFHGYQQCTSCTNLGRFANATINRIYMSEVGSGKIRYLDINAEAEPQNEFVVKYRPTHASLYLVVNSAGNETIQELVEAWYYTGDEAEYERYLVGVLGPYLG